MGSKPDANGFYDEPIENLRRMRVVVIGAGFSGIYLGIRIPQRLRNVDLVIYDKNAGIGGTWFENKYPGCACDVASHSYQFTFRPNPLWSNIYAPAPEILAYLNTVAEEFSVPRFVKLQHKVEGMEWQQDKRKWHIKVNNLATGQSFLDEADVVISAKGALNDIRWPNIEGFDKLKIPKVHTAAWDDSLVFENKRVGVIGAGSSSIQVVPKLQKREGVHLSVFARTKTWIVSQFYEQAMQELGLDNAFTEEQRKQWADDPELYQKLRIAIEKAGCCVHELTLADSPLQKMVREGVTAAAREKLASKPEIQEFFVPGFAVGCRRLTPGPGYLDALVQDNVEFITTGIKEAYDNGLELVDGRKVDLDVLVCATGFHTSLAPPFPIIGRDGVSLEQRWAEFPDTYLSLATDGFPNLFFMFGPSSGVSTGPLTTLFEAAGDYIVKAIRKMQRENIDAMEAQKRRVKDFVAYMDHYFTKTVHVDSCSSWYKRGNSNRIAVIWPGSSLHAIEAMRSPRWEDWDYTYKGEGGRDGEEANRMAWLGNGWSALQLDEAAGDVSYYVQEHHVDIPEAPLPEKGLKYTQRPYAY